MNLLLLVSVLLQAQELETPHYRLRSTGTDRPRLQAVADSLEGNHAALLALLPEGGPDAGRYTLNLYATREEFLKREGELTRGAFASNSAFSSSETGEAYAWLQPRPGTPLFDQPRALYQHEAFHLHSYRRARWLKACPAWLREGLAERASEDRSLAFDAKLWQVRRALDQRRWISLADLMSEDRSRDADDYVQLLFYAESWLLVKYLIEAHPEAWRSLRAGLVEGGAPPDRVRSRILGLLDLSMPRLEEAWIAWIRGLEAGPWLAAMGGWRRDGAAGFEGAAGPGQPAVLLHTEAVRSKSYTLSAEVQIEALGAGRADLVAWAAWDHQPRHWWKVHLSREGVVQVAVRKNDERQVVASRRLEGGPIPAERWSAVQVRVEGRTARVTVDGAARIEHVFEDPGVELADILWGVGTFDGWARFRKLELRRDP